MLRYLFTTVLSIILINTIIAQEPIIEWGSEHEPFTDKSYESEVLGTIDGNLFVLAKNPLLGSDPSIFSGHDLLKYSAEGELVYHSYVKPNPGTTINHMDLIGTVIISDRIYNIKTNFVKASQKTTVIVESIDTETGEPNGDDKKLFSIKALKYMNSGTFQVKLSPDKSKMVVLAEHVFNKKEAQKITLAVYETATWTEIWAEDKTMSYMGKRVQQHEVFVDNNGSAYLYKPVKLGKGLFDHFLFSRTNSGSWEETKLDFSENSLREMVFRFNNQQDFLVIGSLSEDKFETHGYFYLNRFSAANGKLEYKNSVRLPKLESISTCDRTIEIGKVDRMALPKSFSLDDVILKKTGGYFMLLEGKNVDKTSRTINEKRFKDYTYNYCDLLVLSFNAQGEVDWHQVISKKQVTKTTQPDVSFIDEEFYNDFGSYVYAEKGNRLFILYNNTAIERTELRGGKYQYVLRKGPEGQTLSKDNFGPKALYGTFLHVIEPDGSMRYQNEYGLPLTKMHQASSFEMAVSPHLFYMDEGKLWLMKKMESGKRIRVGGMKL